jgi:hypothetical protein
MAAVASVTLFATGAAHSANVYLNDSAYANAQVLNSVAGAKYRLDGTNWDMALHSGTGTNDPQPAPADFVQADLGNLGALSGTTFHFVVEYEVGKGFTFSLTDPSNTTRTLSWGDSALGGTNVTTLQRTINGQLDGIAHGPTDDPFNFLIIEARAQRGAGDSNPPEPDSVMTFSNLSFSGTGLTTSGPGLVAGAMNENTAGSAWTPAGVGVENGRYWQFLYSDADLSDYDWTFSADVSGFATGNSPQESLRFELTAKNVAPVPLPAGVWLLLSGLAGLATLRRKNA